MPRGILLLMVLVLVGCGSCAERTDAPGAGSGPAPEATQNPELANVEAPAAGDACKLISKAEAESVVDFALKDGELTELRGGNSTFCVWRGTKTPNGVRLQLFATEGEYSRVKSNAAERVHVLAGIDDEAFVAENMVYAWRNGRSFFVQISKGPADKPISPVVAAAIAGTQEKPANIEAEYQLAKIVSAKLK